ncbi:aldo/keto reductase [Mycobacterium sp. AZCC_0083]|uniref:aldo/keto reductase n=1 Tax=Mycobacterium sp. AZCC_0083 TaxID=2735882 RepID=UPI00160EAFD4|nr:aldo/keto reductase [Mycobacterium sp. AZCC_0083]MBB5164270.1 D-threo-aldose 1-dehydrogenase [Mycobacterium sp. AZCC_0083]
MTPTVGGEHSVRADGSAEQRTAALGFGCASLYGLPARRDRMAVLETAYDAGIRRFDVAPIYGLGVAESELASFLNGRDDICVTTKFGIRPTRLCRVAGRIQPPARQVLRRSSGLKAKVKTSGAKRGSGTVGRLLYGAHDYSVGNARRCLTASLRTLRTERIDYFFLHEPVGQLGPGISELADYLDTEQSRGVIGHWGPAGDLSQMDGNLTELSRRASAMQFPYDLTGGFAGPDPEQQQRPTITFGFIAATLPIVRAVLEKDPALRRRCSDLLDADITDQRVVFALLVRDAVRRNPFGVVLLSSTKTENVRAACAAANVALRHEDEVAGTIRQACRATEAAR